METAMSNKRNEHGYIDRQQEYLSTHHMVGERSDRLNLTFRMPVYRYAGYWRSWSRYFGIRNGAYAEMTLTTTVASEYGWRDVMRAKLRLHYTTRDPNQDAIALAVPGDWVEVMKEKLDPTTADLMLAVDWLSLVDWRLYAEREKAGNGGVPFSWIIKPEVWQKNHLPAKLIVPYTGQTLVVE